MEPTSIPGGAQLTGNVLFYSRPEPLSSETHAALGVKRSENPFRFAASTHIVPITVTEFAPAGLSYPIIFAGEGRLPVAVFGVNQGENLFVDEKGNFEIDAYLPAYVRRYPFVFANDEQGERLIVCIDRGSEVVGENPDVPFFENGEPTEFTKGAIKFCEEFETERRRTEAFVKLLSDNDLFEVKQAVFTPRNADGTAGTPQTIAEYFAVSEEKLNKLPTEKFLELRDNGALSQIYAHLVSLLGWERVMARALARGRNQPTAGNA